MALGFGFLVLYINNTTIKLFCQQKFFILIILKTFYIIAESLFSTLIAYCYYYLCTGKLRKISQRGGNMTTNPEQTMLNDACAKGDIKEVEKLLDKGVDINGATFYSQDTPLVYAIRNGHAETVNLLIDRGADIACNNNAPLVVAVWKGDAKIVQLILDRNVDVNAKDSDGDTPLILATREGHTEIVKLLLDSGANIEARNDNGNTALIYAAFYGYSEIADLLLNKGADMEAKNIFGNTPLIFTLRHGHLDIVELLVSKGADIEAKNNKGRTAISYAFNIKDEYKRQEVLELFNYYHPEVFMTGYLDWNTGAGR
jgi:ankyrin repeat protein